MSNLPVKEAPDPALAVQPPVLISESQVMLATAAAVRPPRTGIRQRTIAKLRAVGAGLRLPPPRPIYSRASYLERSCMARAMDRL
jgi:hypothetical protein